MLETLAGRVKWEHTGDGIRVVIPARLSWGATLRLLKDLGAYFAAFSSIFVTAGSVAWFRGLSFHSFITSKGIYSLYLSSLGCCSGLVLARVIPRIFGETVVTMSPDQTTIEWNARASRSKAALPTAILHNFRFVERSSKTPVQNKFRQNEIQVGQTHWTRSFGEGVTREEAEALIAKMNEIYPFPKHLPTESAGTSAAK